MMSDYECRSCGEYLTGRQALFCSEKCRKRHARAEARFKGVSPAEADRKAREEHKAELKRQAEQAEKAAAIKTQRLSPCAECGEPFRRTRGRGRIATYCSVACRSRAQRQRQHERNTVPDEFDQLLEQINRDRAARRVWHGATLASLEERVNRLEATTWQAVELAAENGDPNRCNSQLQNLARIRAELNDLWTELDSPAPRWGLFYV